MIWTSDEGVAGAAMLAFNLGTGTTSDEPDIETTTTVMQDTNLESSSSTGDADDSNGGAIAGAILGTIGVAAVLAAVIYVRQQRQTTTKQLEDGNSRHNSRHLSNSEPDSALAGGRRRGLPGCPEFERPGDPARVGQARKSDTPQPGGTGDHTQLELQRHARNEASRINANSFLPNILTFCDLAVIAAAVRSKVNNALTYF